ncbi:MAG: phosphoribosyltransferase family protein [Candidatus Roizmanbacteria bacterium]|nr:phosphoribosyltransferase family protein [Candidatus Roizmanbacteria bacterium]
MIHNKILFKKTQFLKESWSYIAPTWEEMGQMCLSLGTDILEKNKRFDTLITLAKGGWTWARTMADILQIFELSSFKLTFYDSSQPGKKLSKPMLEIPLTIPLARKRIFLFDDVNDSGESLGYALKYLDHFGPSSITTATLFHKPHSKFKPDFFGAETDAWVVFPHERREVIDGLALKWKKTGIKIPEIRERLIKIGLPEKEVNIFLK